MNAIEGWRSRAQRYRLVGEVCEGCGGKIFPPRDVCPSCGSTNTGGDLLKEAILNPEILRRSIQL